MSTHVRTLRRGAPGAGGYQPLQSGPGEVHESRTELGTASAAATEPLLAIAQLSDLHVCDHQSPARVEFFDRWADPDSPLRDLLAEVGTYRAQELLTTQVLEASVRAINAVPAGPLTGAPIELAVLTGDNTDNSQANELDWYLTLLEGGRVVPDSGDGDRYEGVSDAAWVDDRYWHPEAAESDLPSSRYGFPHVPGLLDAARRPFTATGLRVPWLGVHGNHDQLVQGTLVASEVLAAVAVGGRKPVSLPIGMTADEVLQLLMGLEACDPAAIGTLARLHSRPVTADAGRRIVDRPEFVRAHHRAGARPPGHGFTDAERAYYRHDQGPVTMLVLDTVNEYGGWQGSLDREQYDWLADELADADRDRRYVVIGSHHPLETLVNDAGPDRLLGDAVQALLTSHPCVVLWLAGHTHAIAATPLDTYWQVVAPSLIDWPQQGRIVEIARGAGTLTIGATMLDHCGEAPWGGGTDAIEELAGLSRELSANAWQWRHLAEHPRSGRQGERNVLLHLPDPFA